MRFTRRDFLKLCGLGGATLILRSRVPPPIRALRILAPSRSVSASTIQDFQQAMGIEVKVDLVDQTSQVFKTFEVLNSDLAIVPSHILTHLIRNDLMRELPPATSNQPLTTSDQRPYDPFNTFSQLASRGIIGINARNIQPPQTWKEFFELAQHTPTYLPPLESLNAALKSFGESINTRNTYLREKAQSLILNLQSFPLRQSQLAIAPPLEGWNFIAPLEGVEMWEDSFCIPQTTSQTELAQKFIELALTKQKLESLPDVRTELLSAFAMIELITSSPLTPSSSSFCLTALTL